LGPNAFRAPAFAPTSQICSFAFEPAAATVSGSSGEKEAVKTLPYSRISARIQSRQQDKPYYAKIATGDKRDILDSIAICVDVPKLNKLIGSTGDEASTQMRVHVNR
jgi:hypothetical protein